MTRETSIEAYREIEANGLLSNRRFQFYHVLFKYGPLTANEAAAHVEAEFGVNLSSSGIGSRLSELRELGVVKEVGERIDSKTGMTCIAWDVTSGLPGEIKERDTESKTDKIKRLEAKVTELEAEVDRLHRERDRLMAERDLAKYQHHQRKPEVRYDGDQGTFL